MARTKQTARKSTTGAPTQARGRGIGTKGSKGVKRAMGKDVQPSS